MGSVVDYFKPITGKTFCEMLQGYKLHQWSSNGLIWQIPNYYTGHLGGSAYNYPTDGRSHLSFWGGHGNKGGCCHSSYSDGGAWKRAFKISYGLGISY